MSGNIEELEHDPRNEKGVVILLRDDEGMFLECHPEEDP